MSQLPLFNSPVSCGFPSPAEDFSERRIWGQFRYRELLNGKPVF